MKPVFVCLLAAGTLAANAQSLKTACMANDAKACITLAEKYKSSDLADAARYYGVACDGGSTSGCFKLGDMFADGRHLKLVSLLSPEVLAHIDPADAVGATTKGVVVTNIALSDQCARGQMDDCLDLADLLRFGEGLSQDLYRAASLYTQTCKNGISPGCSSLAQMFHYGWGVSKDTGNALRVYTKACGQGNNQGCVGVGRIFSGGRNADRELAYEVKMARIACDKHMTPTCWRWE